MPTNLKIRAKIQYEDGGSSPTDKVMKSNSSRVITLETDEDSGGASTGVVPVGAILDWHKSMTGVPSLPSEFLECNGQTISDAASPMNGGATPSLNGTTDNTKKFIRGSTTSGATGSTSQHAHTVSTTSTSISSGVSVNIGTTDTVSHVPPFFEAVKIMRIK